ncbi:MAG: hypothetical protein IPK68_15605 [Bdellovibrionales bacterium]|nr:hypothetical protein [Bdellovibrionales bacterium]
MKIIIKLAFLILSFTPAVSFGLPRIITNPEDIRRIERNWKPGMKIDVKYIDGGFCYCVITSFAIDSSGKVMRLELEPRGGTSSPLADSTNANPITLYPDRPSISETDGSRNSPAHGAKSDQENIEAGQSGTSSRSTEEVGVGAGVGVIEGLAGVAGVLIERSPDANALKENQEAIAADKSAISENEQKIREGELNAKKRIEEVGDEFRKGREALVDLRSDKLRGPDKNSIVKSTLIAPGSGYVEPVLQAIKSVPAGYTSQPIEKNDVQCGSVIFVDSLSLGETIPLNGTPFSLVYFSDRVIGRRGDYQVEIPAQAGQKKSVGSVLTIKLAGRSNSVDISPWSFGFGFAWDGSDSQGKQVWSKARAELALNNPPMSWTTFVGNFKPAYLGLGGWGLNVIHYLSFEEGIIYLGNGQTRAVKGSLATLSDRIELPSADGLEVYAFDSKGLHRETRLGLTGECCGLSPMIKTERSCQ